MSSYKVTLYFSDIRSGLTEVDFIPLLHRSIKHVPFEWYIDEFAEVEAEGNDCE